MLSHVAGAGGRAGHKGKQASPCPQGANILEREADNKQITKSMYNITSEGDKQKLKQCEGVKCGQETSRIWWLLVRL